MVFKILSYSGAFTRVYVDTTLPQWGAAKPDIACPCVPRTSWACPNPCHPHTTCPFLTLLRVGCSSSSSGPSSPTASDTPGTHLGEEGPVSPWLLALSAPQGRDLMLFASPEVFCSRLKLPGTVNNNPGRRWQQGSVTRG